MKKLRRRSFLHLLLHVAKAPRQRGLRPRVFSEPSGGRLRRVPADEALHRGRLRDQAWSVGPGPEVRGPVRARALRTHDGQARGKADEAVARELKFLRNFADDRFWRL